MKKATTKAGRKKTEGIPQTKETKTIQQPRLPLRFHWEPNRYAYIVGRNVLIAAIALGIPYATLTYFGTTVSPSKTTATDKAHPDSTSDHKAKHATASEDQRKKRKNEVNELATSAPNGTTAFVSGNNVVIRENPKLNAKILGRAIFGTSIEVLALDGNWVQIHSSAQNLSGWTEKSRLNF